MQLNPYLLSNGNCEEAFNFYAQCLRGKIDAMMTFAGTPAEKQVPPEWKNKILHCNLIVGGQMLMGSDAPPGNFSQPQGMQVSISVQDPAEAERIFNALSQGGKTTMPFGKTFWAERFGMATDPFGIPWIVNCPPAAQRAA